MLLQQWQLPPSYADNCTHLARAPRPVRVRGLIPDHETQRTATEQA